MAEFKFSCPQCGQHIQCDTGYAGMQINCPSCKQAIVVPQSSATAAPRSVTPAAPPAPAAPPVPATPPGLATRQSTAAPAPGQRFGAAAAQPPAKKKSKALRNTIIITAVVLVLAVFGAGGWFVYSGVKTVKARLQASKGNPDAMVAAPTAASASAAMDIMAKVHQAYTNLNSLSMEGTSRMVIDMSQITMADVNPNAKNKNTARRAASIPKGMTNSSEVSVKLSRPGMFLIQGKGTMDMGKMVQTNISAVWSAGQTNYSLAMMGQFKRYTSVSARSDALMSVNQGGGSLSSAVAALFFGDENPMARFMTDWGQTEDQTLDGQDCYTVTTKMMGQKLKLWINKSSYLIVQSEITLGAPVSDTDIETAISMFDKSTNKSTAQVAKEKLMAKTQAAMMTKIRGTATETYDTVQVNPTLTADDFNYPVPKGVRLTPSGQ